MYVHNWGKNHFIMRLILICVEQHFEFIIFSIKLLSPR
jgi:hypothetical protein